MTCATAADCERAIGRNRLIRMDCQDGETIDCPNCGKRWVHVCDEAEGCEWCPAAPQQKGGVMPTNDAIVLAAFLLDGDWRAADELRHALKRFGLRMPSSQWTTAQLMAMTKEECPRFEVRPCAYGGYNEYRPTHWAANGLSNEWKGFERPGFAADVASENARLRRTLLDLLGTAGTLDTQTGLAGRHPEQKVKEYARRCEAVADRIRQAAAIAISPTQQNKTNQPQGEGR